MPRALGELESFLHADDELPLLIRIGLAHAQFETIHPFLDGNGRVGRLLITFLLTERGVLHKPVLYLSHWFKQHRQQYYDRLQAVRDRGEWEEWIAFFLRGVEQVSIAATDTTRRVLELRERHRAAITEQLGRAAGNGHRVHESLFHRPIVTVGVVQEQTGVSFAAANQLVARLVGVGVLREITGYSRNRRFMYDEYVRLFTESGKGEGLTVEAVWKGEGVDKQFQEASTHTWTCGCRRAGVPGATRGMPLTALRVRSFVSDLAN